MTTTEVWRSDLVGIHSEFDLIPTTGSCAASATTVLVKGGLFFRPDGSIADGSLGTDPQCFTNDTVELKSSGFVFAPAP